MFSVYVNSSQLTTRVEYFAIIRSRLIAECFVFIFYFNATAADMKKFRVSAYRRINTVITFKEFRWITITQKDTTGGCYSLTLITTVYGWLKENW